MPIAVSRTARLEDRGEHCRRPSCAQAAGDPRVHRLDVGDRKIAVEAPDHLLQRRSEGLRRGARSQHDEQIADRAGGRSGSRRALRGVVSHVRLFYGTDDAHDGERLRVRPFIAAEEGAVPAPGRAASIAVRSPDRRRRRAASRVCRQRSGSDLPSAAAPSLRNNRHPRRTSNGHARTRRAETRSLHPYRALDVVAAERHVGRDTGGANARRGAERHQPHPDSKQTGLVTVEERLGERLRAPHDGAHICYHSAVGRCGRRDPFVQFVQCCGRLGETVPRPRRIQCP